MKRIALILFSIVSVSAAYAADPYAGYIYPSGIQVGTTNRFIVGGQYFWHLKGAYFNRAGLRVLEIKPVPGFGSISGKQRLHLKNWLDGIAKGIKEEPPKPNDPHISEWRSNVWWNALGSLPPLELSLVERFLFIPRNPLQDAPSLRQMSIVTIAANPDAKPGAYSYSIWGGGGISAPRPFYVSVSSRVAEPLFMPPYRGKPEPPVVDAMHSGVILDGQIMPGETDVFKLKLSGGRRYSVKVTARELQPYVGDAVPGFFNPSVTVKDSSGKVVSAADDAARFRPDPMFTFKPAVSGLYSLEIHDVLYRGRADFVYSIEVSPYVLPSRRRSESKNAEVVAKDGSFRFSGTVSEPGGKSVCEFTVDKPGKRVFDVCARRAGSSIDAVLTLRKVSGGGLLGQWDDTTNRFFVGTIPQSECDPAGEYHFKTPGRYVAEISDRTGHGGDDYFWDLSIRRPSPGFEVYSARSTLPLLYGRPLNVDFIVVRKDGFTGPVALEFPKGVTAKENVITSGVDRIKSKLIYVGRETLNPQRTKIFARAKIGGRTVRREVVPCDEYEQAFAWQHLVPAESFVIRTIPRRFPKRK